jgi:1,4-alpha-glucan branching enzyme
MREENWLFEAITETYIPLLSIFNALVSDRIPFRITMSLTPTLCTMLSDPLLQNRYINYLSRLIELAAKETVRLKKNPAFLDTAARYLDNFTTCRSLFIDRYDCNLVKAFRSLQDQGVIEIITSAATHGFLPNMQYNTNAVRAQIQVAVQSHLCFFGRQPSGIWLPECGYYPGVEKLLHEAGLQYFFTDTHGNLFAEPRPQYGAFASVFCKDTAIAAFGRDIESSKSVWSSQTGYPGDFAYRDYYRDIGFDLDLDYIRPYIDPNGHRIHTGIKYHRITGKDEHKEPYRYYGALDRAFEHAGNFLFNRQKQVEYLCTIMDRKPIIVAPYDAELFGHWWYEGPYWLNYLIRKAAFEQDTISLVTASDYLAEYPTNQVCEPAQSSWGQNGYSEVWLESSNDWIYRHLHMIEEYMVECAQKHPHAKGLARRTLNQMARELLLAQSSDWAFIMKTDTMVEYAVRRIREHIANFLRLYNDLMTGNINKNFISLLELHNNIFPDIDYKVYC